MTEHSHCPCECEHPQPFVLPPPYALAGFEFCGLCFYFGTCSSPGSSRLCMMIPCTPATCPEDDA